MFPAFFSFFSFLDLGFFFDEESRQYVGVFSNSFDFRLKHWHMF